MNSRFLWSFIMTMLVLSANAKQHFPNSDTAKSEVELGVEGVQRLCPTGMWNNWTFRDIMFDRESNTVLMVIQVNSKSWRHRNVEKFRDATESDMLQHTEWIVSNFKTGYEELIANPSIHCDGDFMLYLSLGALFKQMEKDDVKLRIMLIKPDSINQVFGDFPLELSSEQLKKVKPKEDADRTVNPKHIIGDWFAQVDVPQNKMTCLIEINILDEENCILKCRWSRPNHTEEEFGKAKWKLNGNKLIITFPNKEELIRTDNIFKMENIYDISLTKDKFIILNNKQFGNIDVAFGRGYENRGFAEIMFPEDN